ncbi:MAG: hypothetical protein U5N56_00770 [Candidatus Marinimicrobia bacterium]|nr:hypothetical protein [Candidatus Neomarinimicrobiota bacterium]
MMISSDILLLMIGSYENSKGVYTGKIFEYIYSGVPILAIAPKDGVASELIKKTRTGIVVC